MRLKGKHIYITGGTGGIGKPLVKLLEQAGAVVTTHGYRKDGDLWTGLDTICQKLKAETPDILINMAGCHQFAHCEDQDLDRLIDLNLKVPMRLTQAVLPEMKRRNTGQIVLVGSMAGFIPLPHLTGYVAAKAGLKGFNDALRRELAPTDIKLNFIAPRAVKTTMNEGIAKEVNRQTNTKTDRPEDIALRVYKALIDSKTETRIGWPERLFALINALFPKLVDSGLQKTQKIGADLLVKETKAISTPVAGLNVAKLKKETAS